MRKYFTNKGYPLTLNDLDGCRSHLIEIEELDIDDMEVKVSDVSNAVNHASHSDKLIFEDGLRKGFYLPYIEKGY
jgi:hypothetical protein